MNKYKICVYAISKNEEKFVKRWVNSMKEADEIYVLDTGSTDNTVKLLKESGVHVETEVINPWRFDVARNKSLNLVPLDADICVCTDLDEILLPGWRKILEEKYIPGRRINYTYNWHINEDGTPDVSFILNNIHPRDNYFWTHPVHEVLTTNKKEEYFQNLEEIVLNHYPDTKKSRKSYLKLLELSVKENPEDDRNMHYLGREYMYYKKWEKCIETLKKHLSLKSATWNLERAASMRYIARSYLNLQATNDAIYWYKKAIEEAPFCREAYVELAMLYYNNKNWLESIKNLLQALTIKNREKVYINEVFSWDETIDDLLSLSYFELGLFDLSKFHMEKALNINPKNKRILNNLNIIKNYI